MSNLGATLKAEIIRLAKKEAAAAVAALRKENKVLRKNVAALRKNVAAAAKAVRTGLPAAAKGSAVKSAGDEAAAVSSTAIRPTGESVRRLREKFGMSQDEFARLAGVGRITVSRWESSKEKIQFRGAATKARFAEVMKFGKTEAWAAIGGAAKATDAEKQPRRGRPAKAGKAAGKEQGKKPGRRGRPAKAKALPSVVVLAPVAAEGGEKKTETRLRTGKVTRRAKR